MVNCAFALKFSLPKGLFGGKVPASDPRLDEAKIENLLYRPFGFQNFFKELLMHKIRLPRISSLALT